MPELQALPWVQITIVQPAVRLARQKKAAKRKTKITALLLSRKENKDTITH